MDWYQTLANLAPIMSTIYLDPNVEERRLAKQFCYDSLKCVIIHNWLAIKFISDDQIMQTILEKK